MQFSFLATDVNNINLADKDCFLGVMRSMDNMTLPEIMTIVFDRRGRN